MVVKEYMEPPNSGMYGAKAAKQDGGGGDNKDSDEGGDDDSSGDEAESGDGVEATEVCFNIDDEQKVDDPPGTTAET